MYEQAVLGLATPDRDQLEVDGVLASWAVERGMELDELRVSRPSLEDTYLELIR